MTNLRFRVARRRSLWLVVLLCILTLAVDHACCQSIRSSRHANPKVVFGQFPPDFELPSLHFETDANENPVGAEVSAYSLTGVSYWHK